MIDCVNCRYNPDCMWHYIDPDRCGCGNGLPKAMTHGEQIRGMSDSELATMISENIDCEVCIGMFGGIRPCDNGKCCVDHWYHWLQKKANDRNV